MRNRIAVVLCALVLVAGVPLALSAQITSPTANISTGMFLTDADNAFGSLNVVNFSALDGKSIFVGDFVAGQVDFPLLDRLAKPDFHPSPKYQRYPV
jgi:hypothetical protein